MENHNIDNHYDVYDEVIEYLLHEGYSFDEANKIMVSLVNEAGIQDFAKFVGGRLATPLRTAATDLATTAIGLTGLGKGKPPITRVPSPSQTQIVRQAPAKPAAKPPSVVRIPNPWRGSSSGSRLSNVLRGGNQGSSSQAVQPRLRGSTSTVRGALTGSSPRSLPSGTRGGEIVRSTPSSSAITNTRTARPTTPAAQPRLTGSSPRASLPSGSRSSSITPSARTASSVSARSPIQQVRVRDITQDLRRVSPSTQGTRALRAAPRVPNVGAGGPSATSVGRAGLLGLVGASDFLFPRPTARATRNASPQIPTSPGEVKKGQTYYDFSKRIGTSARPAAREKVGPKIVGPGKVGTEAQSFDKAYAQAKQKGGMGSTFTWRGGQYKVY